MWDQVLENVLNSIRDNRITILNGSAGTGKTTMVREIADYIGAVAFTATTHEAAGVLTSKGCKASTIHSHLKLKLGWEKGVRRLLKQGLSDYKYLVIVDEGSMLTSELCYYIEHDVRNKYLIVGDDKQLPPVGEKVSPIFMRGYPTFTLTHVFRQASDNDNIDLSLNLDRLYQKTDGKNYKWINPKTIPSLIDQGAIHVSWRNVIANAVNRRYREIKGVVDPYIVGETVIVQQTIDNYYNGERVVIESISLEEHMTIPVYLINDDLFIPRNEEVMKSVLQKLASEKKWSLFYAIHDSITTVKHPYAMTIHKSQGSTFDNVIVSVTDCLRNPNQEELKKLLYTALTRTSNNNYLY